MTYCRLLAALVAAFLLFFGHLQPGGTAAPLAQVTRTAFVPTPPVEPTPPDICVVRPDLCVTPTTTPEPTPYPTRTPFVPTPTVPPTPFDICVVRPALCVTATPTPEPTPYPTRVAATPFPTTPPPDPCAARPCN